MSEAMDRRTCEEAFRRLDDYLDRELGADERRLVEEHLRICEVCTREFVFEASLLTGVRRKLRTLSAPSDLQARIAARLQPPED